MYISNKIGMMLAICFLNAATMGMFCDIIWGTIGGQWDAKREKCGKRQKIHQYSEIWVKQL